MRVEIRIYGMLLITLPIYGVIAAHYKVGFVVEEQTVNSSLHIQCFQPGLARLPVLHGGGDMSKQATISVKKG